MFFSTAAASSGSAPLIDLSYPFTYKDRLIGQKSNKSTDVPGVVHTGVQSPLIIVELAQFLHGQVTDYDGGRPCVIQYLPG